MLSLSQNILGSTSLAQDASPTTYYFNDCPEFLFISFYSLEIDHELKASESIQAPFTGPKGMYLAAFLQNVGIPTTQVVTFGNQVSFFIFENIYWGTVDLKYYINFECTVK